MSRCSSRVIYCFENHFFCCCLFSKAVLHNNVTRRKKSVAAAAVATCFCCCDTMHALFSVVVVILLAKRPFSIITKIALNSWLLRDPRLKIKEKSESILLENYSKCCIWVLAFSNNFCPIKTDLSGNTVWQASGFQKLAKMDHFWHF